MDTFWEKIVVGGQKGDFGMGSYCEISKNFRKNLELQSVAKERKTGRK